MQTSPQKGQETFCHRQATLISGHTGLLQIAQGDPRLPLQVFLWKIWPCVKLWQSSRAKDPKDQHPCPEMTGKGDACGWVPGAECAKPVPPCCSGTESSAAPLCPSAKLTWSVSEQRTGHVGLWGVGNYWRTGCMLLSSPMQAGVPNPFSQSHEELSHSENQMLKEKLKWKDLLKGRGESNRVDIFFFWWL